MIQYLPTYSVMDSVYFGSVHNPVHFHRVSWWQRVTCKHPVVQRAVWIDHRAGPGSFADTHFLMACTKCGKVFGPAKQD